MRDVYTLGVMLYELACGELPYGTREVPAVEIDHGVRDGAGGPTGRWIESFDDGTFVVADLEMHSFAELHAAIRAATTYKLKN